MINLDQYDYLDIGCSSGGAKGYVGKLGGKKGAGITLDKARLKKGTEAGLDVSALDPASRESYKGKVKLSIISGYLERLETYADATATIATALHVTRNVLVIRAPWFDSDGANLSVGVKTFWSDWKANKFAVTSLHLLRFLLPLIEKGGITRFAILGYRPITSASDEHIVPLSAERDSSKYDAAKHGAKPDIALPVPTFVELIVVASRKDTAAVDAAIEALGETTVIFDSAATTDATLSPVPAADVVQKAEASAPVATPPLLKPTLMGRRMR